VAQAKGPCFVGFLTLVRKFENVFKSFLTSVKNRMIIGSRSMELVSRGLHWMKLVSQPNFCGINLKITPLTQGDPHEVSFVGLILSPK
jgi:hypothetical protein